MEKRTIYAVTTGSYSDYRVLCLFEIEADAEANAAARIEDGSTTYGDATVEEFDYYPPGVVPESVVRHRWSCVVTPELEVAKESKTTETVWDADEIPRWRRPEAFVNERDAYGTSVLVIGNDERGVAQSYSDNIAMIKAAPLPPTRDEQRIEMIERGVRAFARFPRTLISASTSDTYLSINSDLKTWGQEG